MRHYLLAIPYLGIVVRSCFQRWRIARADIHARRVRFFSPSLPDPDQVFWIDPAKIVRHTDFSRSVQNLSPEDRVFDTLRDKGKVYSGDWDLSTFKFSDLSVYKAIEDRIQSNRNWSETEFYRSLSQNLSEDTPWRIRSLADLDKRCDYIDALIENIRTEGFRQAHEVLLAEEPRSLKHHPKYGNFVTVNIGRTGEFLFQDGRHRLAIAQVLRVPKIPVKVLVRHSEWVAIRTKVKKAQSPRNMTEHRSRETLGDESHPDLRDILTKS